MRHVGIFEAKTHLSALVEAAERGETIIVTRNGKPVAQISRFEPGRASLTKAQAIEDLIRMRGEMIARGQTATSEEIREWIDEGKRF